MQYLNDAKSNPENFDYYIGAVLENPQKDNKNLLIREIDAYDPVSGKTALINAIESNNIDAVRILLSVGADVNFITPIKTCALLSALRFPQILQYLIKAGANVNITLSERRTPLHFAVHSENLEAVIILLEHGAKVNAEDLYGNTPLHTGIHKKKIGRILLDHGADLHARNDQGVTPAHMSYSIGIGDFEYMKELIEKGVSVKEYMPGGCNALHCACQLKGVHIKKEQLEYIKFLVEEQEMDVNQTGLAAPGIAPLGDCTSLTPFMYAIMSQYRLEDDFEILEYLLSKGANINMSVFNYLHDDSYIFTSTLSWAKAWNTPRYILQWMIQHGAGATPEIYEETSPPSESYIDEHTSSSNMYYGKITGFEC
jgi:ankyrin repeat protein